MIVTTYCPNGCCAITTTNRPLRRQYYYTKNRTKAGALIYDPQTERILLIQSRHLKWGLPKGSAEEKDETIHATALREVQEETGITIPQELIMSAPLHRVFRCSYYYIKLPLQPVKLLETADNDSTGMTWIRPECLTQLVRNGTMDVNAHFRKIFHDIFKVTI